MSDKKPDLDSLFEPAAQLKSGTERAAFLDQSCGGDLELRQSLHSDEQAASFLKMLGQTFMEAPRISLRDSGKEGSAPSITFGRRRRFCDERRRTC